MARSDTTTDRSEAAAPLSILVIHADAADFARRIGDRFDQVKVAAATGPASVPDDLADVEVLMALGPSMSDDLLRRMPRLRWIQFLSSGTDRLATLTAVPEDAVVTSARGQQGPAVSEMALLLMLALSRDFHRTLDNQRAHLWRKSNQPLLDGKTAAIVGTGTISQTLAQRCRALGMRTLGLSATPRQIDGFDHVAPRDEIRSVVAQADFVVALVPLGIQTRGLIDAEVFRAMKPSAYFINLARGAVCVECDLIAALRDGQIAGAGLDVFETEPLPRDSPLWDMPNVIVTPHVAGEADRYADIMMPVIEVNLSHYLNGDSGSMVNLKPR